MICWGKLKEFSYIVAGAKSFDDAKREFLNGLTDDERRMEQSFEQQTRAYKEKHIEYFGHKMEPSMFSAIIAVIATLFFVIFSLYFLSLG